jgi:DNA-binding NarL/FixJ family response regulator
MLASSSAPSAAPPRVFATALVVDDHPLFCDALAITLRAVAGVGRTEAADSLGAALERLAQGGVDLIVLDLHLPDVSGLEGLVRLRGVARGAPVVVVSSLNDPRVIAAAVGAGAAGFVPKHSPREVFREALARVAQGGVWVPPGVSLETAPPAGAPAEALARLALLTRQQARILELICEGKLNKQIAYELAIADATVKAHVTALMRKLGVQTRTQAVLLARQASFSSILQE